MKNNVILLLQPRTFKNKKIHKKRSICFFKKNNLLCFGTSGLLLLKPIRLTSTHLTRYKLFLKKAVRKFDKTKRSFWFNGFPHLPLTRKPTGSRMGKGKGKVHKWFVQLKGGIFLFEFVNLRQGRAIYFMKQMTYKLGLPTKFFFQNKYNINCQYLKSQNTFYNVIWQ